MTDSHIRDAMKTFSDNDEKQTDSVFFPITPGSHAFYKSSSLGYLEEYSDYKTHTQNDHKSCARSISTHRELSSPLHYDCEITDRQRNVSGCEIATESPAFFSNKDKDRMSKDLTIYDNILHEIRDMRVLSPFHIYYLKGVSRHKLLHVIVMYNTVMHSVNEIL